MKILFYFILILSLIYLNSSSCRPEFLGYDCDTLDNKSTLQIDNDYYSFYDEKIHYTEISEKDSLIYINYSITHYVQPINHIDVKINDAIEINIILKKISDSNLVLNKKNSTVRFIQLNNSQIFDFDDCKINIFEYKACSCCDELKTSFRAPGILNIQILGTLKFENMHKSINFHIKSETIKVSVYAK